MNAKAAALGMNDTHFHNPAGLDNEAVGPDLGDHYSTAADMMRLSRAAMDNPMTAAVAGAVSHHITRHFNIGGTPVDVPWTINNIYGGVLQNSSADFRGIKGGATPKAQATGLYAAEDPQGGTALVGTFYTPFTVSDDECLPNAVRLMKLALAECGYEFMAAEDPGAISTILPSLWSDSGSCQGGGSEIARRGSGDHAVSLYRYDDGSDEGHVALRARRNSEIEVADAANVELGILPFESHEGIAFTNMSEWPVQFAVTFDYGLGGTTYFDLEPGERDSLDAYDSGGVILAETSLVLTNTTGEPAYLGMEELYLFNVAVPVAVGDGLVWRANVKRNGTVVADGLDVIVQGQDASAVAHLRAVIENPRYLTGVGLDIAPQPPRTMLSLKPPYPNPFTGETFFAFELSRASEGRIRIFDARGRRVRDLGLQRWSAGHHMIGWDGRDDHGRGVAQGVYLYEVRLNGRLEGSGKAVLLR
jgi:hypothetical protein